MSYAKLKLNRRVGRQRQRKPIFVFNPASAGLAPVVALASTSFANPAFLLLAVVLVNPFASLGLYKGLRYPLRSVE
jgi:hypothetical protein